MVRSVACTQKHYQANETLEIQLCRVRQTDGDQFASTMRYAEVEGNTRQWTGGQSHCARVGRSAVSRFRPSLAERQPQR